MSVARGNPERWSPTVRRQRLAHVLAHLRAQDGRSTAQIAALLGVAESTVTRLEAPKHLTLPKPDLISRLLDVYDADTDTRQRVAVLVEEARHRDWWHPYKAALPAASATYLGLEGETAVQRMFQPGLIPGILQTLTYATVLIPEQLPDLPPERVAEFAAERHQRHQRLLTGPDPVRLWVVLGEAALRQQVGGPAVMADQLQHLLHLMDLPTVTLAVLPQEAGAHGGLAPFTVLTFPEPTDPEAAYLPDPLGGHWVRDRRGVDRLRATFEELLLLQPDRDTSVGMVNTALHRFRA